MPSIKTLFQLPPQTIRTFFENISIRPDGTLLVTRLDVPELWTVNPTSGTASCLLSVGGEGYSSLTGICCLSGDVFAFAAGCYDFATGSQLGSWSIWTVDLTETEPKVAKVVSMLENGLINGIETWDERTVLVTDCLNGKVYKLDVPSKKYEVTLDHELMTIPKGSQTPLGINGIKVHRTPSQTYIYWSTTSRSAVYRVQVGTNIKPTGPVEIIVENVECDDMQITKDGVVYVCLDRTIVAVAGPGAEVAIVAVDGNSIDVYGCTACVFGKGREDVLYVSTAGSNPALEDRKLEPAKVVEIRLA